MSFFYEILNDGTPYRRKKLRVKRLILTIAAALFMLITLLCSFAIIPSGYTGVRTTFGQIDTVAVSNGFIVKIPYVQSIKRVNNKQQEVSYTDQIWGESSERTVVYAAGVTVTYRINPDYSAWIYANVSDYKQNALPQTLLSSAIKAACSRHRGSWLYLYHLLFHNAPLKLLSYSLPRISRRKIGSCRLIIKVFSYSTC